MLQPGSTKRAHRVLSVENRIQISMSPLAERIRTATEWALRLIALTLLVWCLLLALGIGRDERTEIGSSATLRESLERWTTVSSPARIHVALDHPPSGPEQDWLAALSGAGTTVEWSGEELLPTAISIEPRADPAGGADVSIAAPKGSLVLLRDTLGTLDSTQAGPHGVHAYIARPRQTLEAVVGPVTATAALHDSLQLKRLLVLGSASWETKFTTAALEERGWSVDTHVPISPQTNVLQGNVATIDTARYSAVLVLDTTAAPYAQQISRYVRSGGGLILWSPAARTRGLSPLAPGRPGKPLEDEGRAPRDEAPRQDLALVPITSLAEDAIALERRGEDIALAARRVGSGRVLQTGYVNSWRWRMAGGEDAPEAHRTWLAGLVSSVAYTGRAQLAAPPTDPAPLARLIDRLGPPSPAQPADQPPRPEELLPWIFAALCAALLLEWLSRRTRGVR